jgi:hypothetical protein
MELSYPKLQEVLPKIVRRLMLAIPETVSRRVFIAFWRWKSLIHSFQRLSNHQDLRRYFHILCIRHVRRTAQNWGAVVLMKGILWSVTETNLGRMVVFYKPVVETYLRELAALGKTDADTLSSWCTTKRMTLDKSLAVSIESISGAAVRESSTCFPRWKIISAADWPNVRLLARCSVWTLGSLLDMFWHNTTIWLGIYIMFTGTPHLSLAG